MSSASEKKERKRAVPPIPWLGSPSSPGLLNGLTLWLGTPGGMGLAVGLIGLAAGSIMLWGPALTDRLSGASDGQAAPGFWSAWYGDGEDRGLGPLSSRRDPNSLEYLAEANRGQYPSDLPAGEGGGDGALDGAGAEGEGGDPAEAPGAAGSGSSGVEPRTIAAPDHGSGDRPNLAGGGIGALSTNLSGGRGSSAGISASGAGAGGGRAGKGEGGEEGSRLSSARGRNLLAKRPGMGRSGGGSSSAIGQLKQAAKISRAGRSLPPESARATESAAFEPGAAGAVAGEGTGLHQGGVGAATPDSQPSMSDLSDFKQVPPTIGRGRNKTPYQNFITMGRLLVALADFLLFGAAMLSKKGFKAQAKLLALAAIFISLIVVGIGWGISRKYGQADQGGILMASGATAAGIAALALAIGKWQPFLFALAGVASGTIAAVGVFMSNRLPG